MTQLRHDYINNLFGVLMRSFESKDEKAAMDAVIGLGAGTLIDINRCADALERIADVQEARLKIETAKAQLMTKAMTPPPPLATRVILNPGELGG